MSRDEKCRPVVASRAHTREPNRETTPTATRLTQHAVVTSDPDRNAPVSSLLTLLRLATDAALPLSATLFRKRKVALNRPFASGGRSRQCPTASAHRRAELGRGSPPRRLAKPTSSGPSCHRRELLRARVEGGGLGTRWSSGSCTSTADGLGSLGVSTPCVRFFSPWLSGTRGIWSTLHVYYGTSRH